MANCTWRDATRPLQRRERAILQPLSRALGSTTLPQSRSIDLRCGCCCCLLRTRRESFGTMLATFCNATFCVTCCHRSRGELPKEMKLRKYSQADDAGAPHMYEVYHTDCRTELSYTDRCSVYYSTDWSKAFRDCVPCLPQTRRVCAFESVIQNIPSSSKVL